MSLLSTGVKFAGHLMVSSVPLGKTPLTLKDREASLATDPALEGITARLTPVDVPRVPVFAFTVTWVAVTFVPHSLIVLPSASLVIRVFTRLTVLVLLVVRTYWQLITIYWPELIAPKPVTEYDCPVGVEYVGAVPSKFAATFDTVHVVSSVKAQVASKVSTRSLLSGWLTERPAVMLIVTLLAPGPLLVTSSGVTSLELNYKTASTTPRASQSTSTRDATQFPFGAPNERPLP